MCQSRALYGVPIALVAHISAFYRTHRSIQHRNPLQPVALNQHCIHFTQLFECVRVNFVLVLRHVQHVGQSEV